jgi:peroxiredoxin
MRRNLQLFLLATALVSLLLCHPAVAQNLQIGSPSPDFNLPGVDGKNHSLDEFKDAELLVIVFTCNHCPTAQAYEDRIKKLVTDYKNKKVAVVAISPNDPLALRPDELGYSDVGDSLEDMKFRAKDHAFNFPYLYDGENQKVSWMFGPVATPHVFVFDRQRKLRYAGRIDDNDKPEYVTSNDTRDAIDALLAGKPVLVDWTRTFGCSPKWAQKRASVKQALDAWAKEPVDLKLLDEKGIKSLVHNDGKKLLLVNVWATFCIPCVAELPEFVKTSQWYRHRGLDLVTISADAPDAKDRALEVLKKNQVSAANYLFDGKSKYKLMEAVDEKSDGAVPHTVLLAPGGKVLYRKSGPVDALELRRAIVGYLGRTY